MMPPPAYFPADSTVCNGYQNRFAGDAAKTPSVPMSTPPQPETNQPTLPPAADQTTDSKPLRAKKAILALGIMQIAIGGLREIFSAVLLAASSAADPYHYGSGLWGGILTCIAGTFAVMVSRRAPSQRQLTACMVLSIIAVAGASIGLNRDMPWLSTADKMADGRSSWSSESSGPQPNRAALVGCAVGIALSFINIFVSTTCASLMCQNVSCCPCSKIPTGAVMIAIPNANINKVLSKNNWPAGANANIIVMSYNP